MPPRAAGSRRPRFSSREPDTPNQNAPVFQKPNLPPLQGTPSSRRQFSYGAEVEPMASRPGHGLQRNQIVDLSSAVRNVLMRPEDDDELQDSGEILQPQGRLQNSHAAPEIDADELAGPQQPRPAQPSYLSGSFIAGPTGRSLISSRNHGTEGSDAGDVRSFGIESEYYGDATIESTPRVLTSQRSPLRDLRPVHSVSASNKLGSLSRQEKPATASEDEVDLVKQPTQDSRLGPGKSPVGPSPLRSAPRRPPKYVELPEPEKEEEEEEDGEATEEERSLEGEDESEEEEPVVAPPPPRRDININTPGPKRLQPTTRAEIQPRTRLGGPSPTKPPITFTPRPRRPSSNEDPFGPMSNARSNNAAQRMRQPTAQPTHSGLATKRQTASPQSSDSGRWLSRAATSNFSSLFAQAKFLASSPFSITRRYPTDPDERDAAIQRDIDAAEEKIARERRERQAEEGRQRWQQRWLRLRSLIPFSDRSRPDVDSAAPRYESRERNDQTTSQIFQLLNPWTYARAASRLMEAMLDWFMRLIHFIIPTNLWDRLSSVFGVLPHILIGLLAFVLAFVVATHLTSSTDSEWAPNAIRATVQTFDDMRHRISTLVPTVTWPTRERWIDVDDLWEDDSPASDRIGKFLDRMEEEFLTLKRTGNMHGASLKKLENVVPSIVHMETRDGGPVVSQDFWHALRDLINADGGFLTFDKVGAEYEISSEKQWKAIASRLVRDPTFTSKLDLSLGDVEDRMSHKMTTFWDTWVKENDEKITQMLGSAVDQVKSAGSQKEFEGRLEKIVKEQLSQMEHQQGQVVTRDEFLRHLRNEFAAHRSEIRAELGELQPQLEQLIQQSVDLATKNASPGVSQSDITSLVNGLIRKALADMNLEAMARGKIHSHWDMELRNQVNYFAVGSGAVIDAKHSSAVYDPRGQGIVPSDDYVHGLRDARPYPHIAALEAWQDEGDCWCAARSINPRGNPHGATLAIQLSHLIIPQHLVVEHILPGATTQPGTRPKLIEVYADIADPVTRERVRDFSAAYFPDDRNDWNFTPAEFPASFVKISQFVYEGAELHDGVHVHRLSSELMGLRAETDHVIIRAVSNYGAKDQTCFYRVRMYGYNAELDGP